MSPRGLRGRAGMVVEEGDVRWCFVVGFAFVLGMMREKGIVRVVAGFYVRRKCLFVRTEGERRNVNPL